MFESNRVSSGLIRFVCGQLDFFRNDRINSGSIGLVSEKSVTFGVSWIPSGLAGFVRSQSGSFGASRLFGASRILWESIRFIITHLSKTSKFGCTIFKPCFVGNLKNFSQVIT